MTLGVDIGRREAMRVLAIVPTVLATTATAGAAVGLTCLPDGPSPEMAQALAAYRAAVAFQDEWEGRIYSPAWKVCQAAEDAIPHLTTEGRCSLVPGGMLGHMSTDNPAHLAAGRMYKRVMADGRQLGDDDDDTLQEFLEKLDWREAERKRIHKGHNMDALDKDQDRLNDLSIQAMAVIEKFPVTTMADLIAKVEFIKETDGAIGPDELLADLRRVSQH